MRKGPVGGAFGKGGGGGQGYGGGYRGQDREPDNSPRQPTYTNIKVGDVLDIVSAESSRSGSDLTKGVGGGNRLFIRKGSGMEPGWSGKVRVVAQNTTKPYLYTAVPYEEAATRPPEPRAAAPTRTVETVVEQTPVAPPKPPAYQRETIAIGDLGASAGERAVVYVDDKAAQMPILQALEYLIRSGTATSPQGQSVLTTLQAHLNAGRPLFEVAGETPDTRMKLREYLDLYKKEGGLGVGVGEKPKEVKPPAAAEIVKSAAPAVVTSGKSAPASSAREPMPVGAGSRRHGAGLESFL